MIVIAVSIVMMFFISIIQITGSTDRHSFCFSNSVDTAQGTGNEHLCLNVPWQQMQGPLGFSCPASLAMVFEYYGVQVEQDAIFDESFSSRIWPNGTDPVHFPRAASFQDYNGEGWGFQGTTMTLGHLSYEERIEFVKEFLREGIPIVAIVMGYPEWPCHFKVFIGFDERTGNWFFNDPWYQGPDPNGPMSTDSYLPGQRFEGTWTRTNYTIGLVLPIRLNLQMESRPVSASEEFDVTCKLNASYLELDSDVSLSLTLPDGYTILDGDSTPEVNLVGNEAEYTWTVQTPASPSADDQIHVLATASRQNYTTGGFTEIHPFHPEEPIVEKPSTEFEDDNPPFKFNLYSEVAYSDTYSVNVAVFSYSDTARFYPEYYSTEPVDGTINVSIEAFRPGTTVFCWINLVTPFGNFSSEKSIYLIETSDWDEDGIEGYREVSRFGTDPNQNDTDRDFLSDYQEVEVYHTDPLLNDSDSDFLLDGLEIAAGTDPLDSDSDSDGDLDGIEIQYGLDPLDPTSNVAAMTQNQVLLVATIAIVGVVTVIIIIQRKLR
jgi:hypothetical protein